MTIVAEKYEHVIGVDTHAKTHTYAIMAAGTGKSVHTETFPTTAAGLKRATAWMQRRTSGPFLVAIEGTGSYGANLTRYLQSKNIDVCDVRPPKRESRAGRGKSDTIDAEAAARTALAKNTAELGTPRADGLRSALRVLLVARASMDSRRTGDRNALTALLRGFDMGIDARKPITDAHITTISKWQKRHSDEPAMATIRGEGIRLAKNIIDFTTQLDENSAALGKHVDELAPAFRDIQGVGAVTGALVLAAYSHKGRVRSEAAFASLGGASPLQASSGNTVRHRLNRHGDRQLNRALDIIARVRMSCDTPTRDYVERRVAEGKSKREIRRLLKRYIARQLFRKLNHIMA